MFETSNMDSKELIRILTRDNRSLKAVKGSHHHFSHPEKKGKITVPHPKKDLSIGTVNAILKQAGLKLKAMKKIKVTVRKSNGEYFGNTENIEGIVVSSGFSLDELKENMKQAFLFHLEECEKDGDTDFVEKYKNGVEFVYEIDLAGIGKQLPELNFAELSRRLGISPVMMRKYATGKTKASEKRLSEIQKGIREIGKELSEINLL